MTSETNRNHTCHYQDIGEQWRFRRTTEKDHRSFIKWPTCHPRSHRTAIDCAPREGSQQLQVFPGIQDKKGGEIKPFLIPDFVITATYNGSIENEQEIGGSTDASIIRHAPRGMPQ